jgi:hypothetical protein
MAALCLDASLEILQPLCCRRTQPSVWDLCPFLHEGSLQALQIVTMLLVSHVLENLLPTVYNRGVEVWTP